MGRKFSSYRSSRRNTALSKKSTDRMEAELARVEPSRAVVSRMSEEEEMELNRDFEKGFHGIQVTKTIAIE